MKLNVIKLLETNDKNSELEFDLYVVKPGDTVGKIAYGHGMR